MAKEHTIVPDINILIEAFLSKQIETGEIRTDQILIHEAAFLLLEKLSYENKAKGFLGLEEVARLRSQGYEHGFEVKFSGIRPRESELGKLSLDEVNGKSIEIALENTAVFVTADKVQERVAKARGAEYKIVRKGLPKNNKIKIEKYFDENTMSVHLKEQLEPVAKKGMPGSWKLEQIAKTKLSKDKLQELSRDIIETANVREDGFVEIERPGSTIVQLEKYRIVITKPPFSDGWEITAVRPLKHLSLEDYNLSEKLLERVQEQAEGILIAGSPGMGKSTFAQALAENYAEHERIVKTIEAPRDLMLKESVSQYSIAQGDGQEIHDILLLSRPDHTIFDEMRNTNDFELFSDLRLAGIGLAGVVHATNPIDAIQRFVGRVELGVIPYVIDTVLFVRKGTVEKTLSLEMTVKVPAGMTESDLARPVVVVSDFDTGKPQFEMYSYGEQTVVIPVTQEEKRPATYKYAARALEQELANFVRGAKVEVIDNNKIGRAHV